MGASTLYAKIAPEAAAIVDDVARRCGVSKAEFVETLAFHLGTCLDETGIPTWWTRPLGEELHLAS